MEVRKITTWQGKELKEYKKDELINIIEFIGKEMVDLRQQLNEHVGCGLDKIELQALKEAQRAW